MSIHIQFLCYMLIFLLGRIAGPCSKCMFNLARNRQTSFSCACTVSSFQRMIVLVVPILADVCPCFRLGYSSRYVEVYFGFNLDLTEN